MKITYKFATGETSVVEVSDEIGEIIMESRRKEHADNERHRYHTQEYLDGENFLCDELADDFNLEDEVISRIEENPRDKKIREIFNTLTPIQQRRLRMRAAGLTIEKIAEIEGTYNFSVTESLRLARKKFEKLL